MQSARETNDDRWRSVAEPETADLLSPGVGAASNLLEHLT